jgi:hypothetical protein
MHKFSQSDKEQLLKIIIDYIPNMSGQELVNLTTTLLPIVKRIYSNKKQVDEYLSQIYK